MNVSNIANVLLIFCSLTYWGCNGFDGVSRIAGCMPSMSDELVNHHHAIKCS